jgi:subtilase family serine protease
VHSILKATAFLLSLGVALSAYPQATAGNRITQAIDDQETVQIRGNVHPLLERASDQGRMDGGTKIEGVSLIFKRTAEQDAAVEKLLREQQDPSSPNYHKWLTPEQYADRFGLSVEDINKVSSWLQAQGFTVDRVARGRTAVFFTGTVSQIETVFRTEMHRYLVNGESHFANAIEPAVPAAFAEVVVGIGHLDDFLLKPRLKEHIGPFQLTGHFSFGGQNVIAPDDFATIYDLKPLYTAGVNGSGQSIVIVGQSALHTTVVGGTTTYPDLDNFRTNFKLPARSTTNFGTPIVAMGTDPGVVSGDVDEASLDMEWSAGIAPGAKVIFIYAGAANGGAFAAIQYAIDNNSAPIISTSYGACETGLTSANVQFLITLGQQANVQGQTEVAAAGDFGAADCDMTPNLPAQGGIAVDVPAATPYTTGVGGTEFSGDVSNPSLYWSATNNTNNGSALQYIPETTWNDTTLINKLDATGGGASAIFSKPNWQTGTGVPNDGARDVPDIALAASNEHDPYVVCTGGGSTCNDSLFGGTSFGAPTFAGIVAILGQKVGASGGQGNVNPTLYSVAASTPSAFHDITTGNNIVPCGTGTPNCPTSGTKQYGFSAGAGYDQVTGLGTLDVNVLAGAWPAPSTTADFRIYGGVASIGKPGQSATSTIVIDGVHGFNTAVSLTVSCPSSAFITCTLSPSSVTPSGADSTASATLTINTMAAGLERRNTPLWFGGDEVVFASVFVIAVPACRRRWRVAATLLVITFLMAAVGCGGKSSSGGGRGTPAGNYTVTVTGSAGTTTHSTSLLVSVL